MLRLDLACIVKCLTSSILGLEGIDKTRVAMTLFERNMRSLQRGKESIFSNGYGDAGMVCKSSAPKDGERWGYA